MKSLLAIGSGLALFLLSTCPALAGDCGCAAAAPCCAAPASVSFRVEIQETKCPETVEVPGGWKAVEKVVEKEVPVTKMVEVCTIDPCTGCKKIECHPETKMCKAKCITIEFVKTPCTTKTVDKIQSTVNVYMTVAEPCSTCTSCAPACATCGK
jgi:hypothetical protein